MCVDPSTILDGGAPNDVILDDSAANAQLPDTGVPKTDFRTKIRQFITVLRLPAS